MTLQYAIVASLMTLIGIFVLLWALFFPPRRAVPATVAAMEKINTAPTTPTRPVHRSVATATLASTAAATAPAASPAKPKPARKPMFARDFWTSRLAACSRNPDLGRGKPKWTDDKRHRMRAMHVKMRHGAPCGRRVLA